MQVFVYLPFLCSSFFFVFMLLSCSANFNDIFLETVTSPVGDTKTLLSCDGERVADSVSNFLINEGLHDEHLVADYVQMHDLVIKVCTENYWRLPCSRPSSESPRKSSTFKSATACIKANLAPTPFISQENKYVTLHFQQQMDQEERASSPGPETTGGPAGGVMGHFVPYLVILRQNASAEDLTRCTCKKWRCGEDEFEAIQSYLQGVLSAPAF
jgi:hypothetical protein